MTKKQKIDLTPAANPQGIPSTRDPNKVLTNADGSYIVPREYFEEEPSQAIIDLVNGLTSERLYEESLRRGAPRSPRWEARIDMGQIDPELLKKVTRGRETPVGSCRISKAT
jgi:hypothetical protein